MEICPANRGVRIPARLSQFLRRLLLLLLLLLLLPPRPSPPSPLPRSVPTSNHTGRDGCDGHAKLGDDAEEEKPEASSHSHHPIPATCHVPAASDLRFSRATGEEGDGVGVGDSVKRHHRCNARENRFYPSCSLRQTPPALAPAPAPAPLLLCSCSCSCSCSSSLAPAPAPALSPLVLFPLLLDPHLLLTNSLSWC
eukprot:765663-Hanusia_phi.AAC.2